MTEVPGKQPLVGVWSLCHRDFLGGYVFSSGPKNSCICKWRILETRDIKICNISNLQWFKEKYDQQIEFGCYWNLEDWESGQGCTFWDICILFSAISPGNYRASFYKEDPNRKDGWCQQLSKLWLGLEIGATSLRGFTANFPLIPWLRGKEE